LASQGPLEVRRLRLQSHFHSLDWDSVDRWLLIKDAEAAERAVLRDESSLSISRKALRNSIWATIIAVIAIAVSVKDQISALFISLLQ
jgi:hypothetical protein